MARTQPQVSVVIQFLNSSAHLDDAIRSVLWQTFAEWQLILVDGGSTDRSREIARSYADRYPESIVVLEHPGPGTLGIFASRAWGATEASAPILAHLDSDDEWHPRFLEIQLAVFRSNFSDRPGMVYGPMVYTWGPAQAQSAYVQPIPTAGLHEAPSLLIDLLSDGYARSPGNSAVMVSRDILLAARVLMDDAVGITEDQFLWSFIALRYPIFVSPEPLVRYRQWPGSACAKAIAEGEGPLWRARHLQWLCRYIDEHGADEARSRLLAELVAAT